MKIIKAAAVVGLFMPVLVMAQVNTPVVDQRQVNQEARIQQGVASGSLTRKEEAHLEKGQAHVLNMETKAKADGVVTRNEQERLHHAQDVQSGHIYHQKHDRQHDYNHNGRNDHRPHRG